MNKKQYLFKGKTYDRPPFLLTKAQSMELTREGVLKHREGELLLSYQVSRIYKIPYKGKGNISVVFRADSDGVVWGCLPGIGKRSDHTIPCYNGRDWVDKDCMTMIRKTVPADPIDDYILHITMAYGACKVVRNFRCRFW